MKPPPEASSWPTSEPPPTGSPSGHSPYEFERLWRSFMTARATLGLVLMILQGGIYILAAQPDSTPLLICVAYFAVTLAVRLMARPEQLGQMFDPQWLRTVGVDVLTFTTLQVLQGGPINYTPLFALPVLMASILGSMMLAMGAAAGITLLLFAHAAWLSIQTIGDTANYFLQAALTGSGCFAISFAASQLARRLASVELRAQRNQLAATAQRQVNELVIASLAEGILVVDERGAVRSANPAAHLLLNTSSQAYDAELNLNQRPGWRALMEIITASFVSQTPALSDVDIHHLGYGTRHLRVRTQLTASSESNARGLCVVFMQDQREIQARIRAEKLASMGRMSAAVAHEIRNPLAAITQANDLLSEDLTDPGQQRLALMVQQNAMRLENIVQDVLHLTHAPTALGQESAQQVDLLQAADRICRDWKNQNAITDELELRLPTYALTIWFDTDHLRRILINLLDNARRYASGGVACIQVTADTAQEAGAKQVVSLHIWSHGAPLDVSVEQHLFEPFFSSASRSSGLGLYICRELCESHGATISYDRSERLITMRPMQGNEFSVTFKPQSDISPVHVTHHPN